MWIHYDYQSSIAFFNFRMHLFQSCFGEILRVEEEVLVILELSVLLGPKDIHPEDVNRDF